MYASYSGRLYHTILGYLGVRFSVKWTKNEIVGNLEGGTCLGAGDASCLLLTSFSSDMISLYLVECDFNKKLVTNICTWVYITGNVFKTRGQRSRSLTRPSDRYLSVCCPLTPITPLQVQTRRIAVKIRACRELGRVKLLNKKVRFRAVCSRKMQYDTFLSEVLYEADKTLEKFAAALRECACLQDSRWSRRWIANVCFILLFCVIRVLTSSIFVYVCFVDCCFAANR